jgi:hypothetical protein
MNGGNGAEAKGFAGTWKLESSENFDEYMKAVDVGFMMRKMGAVAKPNVIIAVDGEEWTIRSETSFTTNENKFKLNEEFEENTPDGRKCPTTFTLSGDNKLEQKQGGKIPSTITRELLDNGDTLVCTCVANDVTCKRVYKRA